MAERLRAAGIEPVAVVNTAGHPVVYGEWLGAPGKPTALIYGHFDVQPVDPLAQWVSPPFAPEIRDERLYARGASDDKGNMLTPILAVEALLRTAGCLPVNVKFLFEGEEEIGSPSLGAFIDENKTRLACDVVLNADGSQFSEEQGLLLLGLRGLCALQIDVHGPNRDLHSGIYGGTVENPARALATILAALHDSDGRVAVPGFYRDVAELGADERARLAAVPFDEQRYCEKIGLSGLSLQGEAGYTPAERTTIRPTIEINGMWSGFQGEGEKTILPASAHAKLSCRLVADQDPHEVLALVSDFILQAAPAGVRVNISRGESVGYPYRMPADHPANRLTAEILTAVYGHPPVAVYRGGTIPVCGLLLAKLGVYSVNLAFALEDEFQHAPNEFFRLASFRRAQEAFCLMLHRLAASALA